MNFGINWCTHCMSNQYFPEFYISKIEGWEVKEDCQHFIFSCKSIKISSFIVNLGSGVDLKQIDCQMFLQQRCFYLGSVENYNLRSANMASHVQIPTWQGRKMFL